MFLNMSRTLNYIYCIIVFKEVQCGIIILNVNTKWYKCYSNKNEYQQWKYYSNHLNCWATPDWKKHQYSDTGVSRYHEGTIEGTLETPPTSQHYGIERFERFKGALNWSTIMPREASLSGSRWMPVFLLVWTQLPC